LVSSIACRVPSNPVPPPPFSGLREALFDGAGIDCGMRGPLWTVSCGQWGSHATDSWRDGVGNFWIIRLVHPEVAGARANLLSMEGEFSSDGAGILRSDYTCRAVGVRSLFRGAHCRRLSITREWVLHAAAHRCCHCLSTIPGFAGPCCCRVENADGGASRRESHD